jgi:hypothetical protein
MYPGGEKILVRIKQTDDRHGLYQTAKTKVFLDNDI